MALVDEVTGDLMEHETKLLDVLDPAEQAHLRVLMEKLLSAFEYERQDGMVAAFVAAALAVGGGITVAGTGGHGRAGAFAHGGA